MKNWLIIIKNDGCYTEDNPLDVFKFSGSETKVKEEMLNLAIKYRYEVPLYSDVDESEENKIEKEGDRLHMYILIEGATYKIEAIPLSHIPQSNALEFMNKNPKLKELTRKEFYEYLAALKYYDVCGKEKPGIKNIYENVEECFENTGCDAEWKLFLHDCYLMSTGRVLEFS